MWLGPPSIKSQITDFAFAVKCGARAARAKAPSSPSRCAKASAPNSPPAFMRNSRRELTGTTCGISVAIHELVRVEQHVAKVHQRGTPVFRTVLNDFAMRAQEFKRQFLFARVWRAAVGDLKCGLNLPGEIVTCLREDPRRQTL